MVLLESIVDCRWLFRCEKGCYRGFAGDYMYFESVLVFQTLSINPD